MVDISGKTSPYKHSFPNIAFIIPAIVVVGLSVLFVYKLYKSLNEKERKRAEKQKAKEMKKKK